MTTLTDDSVMAIKRQKLFNAGKDLFRGVYVSNVVNFKDRILNNYEYLPRSQVEKDIRYIQPSIYTVITNPLEKSVFLYRRGRPVEFRGYTENRGLGKWSVGVGGHVIKSNLDKRDIIEENLVNKLNYEVSNLGNYCYSFLGYLYSSEDSVSSFHIGLTYIVETNLSKVFPKDGQMTEGSMVSKSRLKSIFKDEKKKFETWSRVLLKDLLEQP